MFTATTARFVVAAIAASFVAVPVWAATARCGGSALCSSSVVNGDSPAQGLLDTISGLQQRSSRPYSEGQPIACFNNICAHYSNTHGRTFTADQALAHGHQIVDMGCNTCGVVEFGGSTASGPTRFIFGYSVGAGYCANNCAA
ncbi:uncharacterized protein PSANT_04884 [Moesziomyces antarcticus]|uniref:Killer toxin Kp4 domain-containing protein n=1 Tax=Pseudozyma antarctica TaxID=84753 RepID=A0A5C3FSK6_PSEA2|nr:uncharacterized protein PSANT_04884 [Moesziomyces antarcticus]